MKLTSHEIFSMLKSPIDVNIFIQDMDGITEQINNKLADYTYEMDHNAAIVFCVVNRKLIGDKYELEQLIKYAGITPHVADKIEIGAILTSSWGYDQTNVDFYCIVEMTAKMVKILPLKSSVTETGNMCGTAMATNDINLRELPLKKKIQSNNYIRIASYSHASLWDGKKKYQSSYH